MSCKLPENWQKVVEQNVMLFNKVLGENEKCVISLPKDQRNPLANPICKCSLILKSECVKGQ